MVEYLEAELRPILVARGTYFAEYQRRNSARHVSRALALRELCEASATARYPARMRDTSVSSAYTPRYGWPSYDLEVPGVKTWRDRPKSKEDWIPGFGVTFTVSKETASNGGPVFRWDGRWFVVPFPGGVAPGEDWVETEALVVPGDLYHEAYHRLFRPTTVEDIMGGPPPKLWYKTPD